MGIFRRLVNNLKGIFGIGEYLKVTPFEVTKAKHLKKRTQNAVKTDRQIMAAAESKRERRIERNKKLEANKQLYGKWNKPRSPYPPLECGFMILLDGVPTLVIRDSVVSDHKDAMVYYRAEFVNHTAVKIDGVEPIVGEYSWTYP